MVRQRRELKYGAKRRYPSKFDIPCSVFDIPAVGGFFFERSLEKDDVLLSVNFLFFWQGLSNCILENPF
jgi:hypothetical protein